eukprot:TRINITY_DN9274_c0_g1_i2.p1 TRINITY_DN9274_c0_g1~~TRINITY_DN9274_c0_g1_i2.p1  ORF type:complete len:345 (-),score=64.66 TRINITY_DN9274_c0_g1_i2:115-1149(-)
MQRGLVGSEMCIRDRYMGINEEEKNIELEIQQNTKKLKIWEREFQVREFETNELKKGVARLSEIRQTFDKYVKGVNTQYSTKLHQLEKFDERLILINGFVMDHKPVETKTKETQEPIPEPVVEIVQAALPIIYEKNEIDLLIVSAENSYDTLTTFLNFYDIKSAQPEESDFISKYRGSSTTQRFEDYEIKLNIVGVGCIKDLPSIDIYVEKIQAIAIVYDFRSKEDVLSHLKLWNKHFQTICPNNDKYLLAIGLYEKDISTLSEIKTYLEGQLIPHRSFESGLIESAKEKVASEIIEAILFEIKKKRGLTQSQCIFPRGLIQQLHVCLVKSNLIVHLCLSLIHI